MRRSHAAAAAAAATVVVLFLWLAVLTFAFHGCSRLGCGSLVKRRSVSLQRKMLLAVTSFDASSATDHHPQQRHHHHHHHHQHHHHHHHHHHHRHSHHDQWNRQGIPPSAGKGEEIDPRYGVQKRLVPTGPNPLHH